MAFVSAGVLLFGPPQDPSKAVASRRLLPSLLLGILRKLSGRGGAEERLLQPLGRACLSVAGETVGGSLLVFFFLFLALSDLLLCRELQHPPHADIKECGTTLVLLCSRPIFCHSYLPCRAQQLRLLLEHPALPSRFLFWWVLFVFC